VQHSQSPMDAGTGGDDNSLACSSAAKLFNISHLPKTLTGKLATPVFDG